MSTGTTITKKDLIDRIAAAHKDEVNRADVKVIVQAFMDALTDELGKGNRLEFRDFGVFEVKKRAARVAQNPKTLEPVRVPPKRTVKFKVGRLIKQRLDELTAAEDASEHNDHGPAPVGRLPMPSTEQHPARDSRNGTLSGRAVRPAV